MWHKMLLNDETSFIHWDPVGIGQSRSSALFFLEKKAAYWRDSDSNLARKKWIEECTAREYSHFSFRTPHFKIIFKIGCRYFFGSHFLF